MKNSNGGNLKKDAKIDGNIREDDFNAELKIAVKTFWRLLPITIIAIIGMKESSTPKNVEKLTKGVTKSNRIETDVNNTNKIDAVEICLKLDQWFSDTDLPRNRFIPTWISILEIFAKIAESVMTRPKTPIMSADEELEIISKNK